jgi:hypothetical protein
MYHHRYIYIRSEFENKTFFSGQDLGVSQYNISGQAYYQGSKGLNIGIAGIRYSQFEPKFNTTIVTAGYNNHVQGVKGLNLRALYSRYFFAKADSVIENSYNSSIDLGLTYKRKFIGSSADLTTLLGNEVSIQANWDVFATIPIIRFGTSNKLSFEPEVSLFFANQTVVVNQYISRFRFFGDVTTETNSFGLMNTMLRVPVTVTVKNLDISAGYNFNFPRIPGSNIKPGNSSFFNLSLGYLFGI